MTQRETIISLLEEALRKIEEEWGECGGCGAADCWTCRARALLLELDAEQSIGILGEPTPEQLRPRQLHPILRLPDPVEENLVELARARKPQLPDTLLGFPVKLDPTISSASQEVRFAPWPSPGPDKYELVGGPMAGRIVTLHEGKEITFAKAPVVAFPMPDASDFLGRYIKKPGVPGKMFWQPGPTTPPTTLTSTEIEKQEEEKRSDDAV